MIRFHLDESVETAVARALNVREIDVTTAVEVGLLSARDEEHLAFALAENRVLVTHDAENSGSTVGEWSSVESSEARIGNRQ